MTTPLFTESEWTFQSLDRVFKAIEILRSRSPAQRLSQSDRDHLDRAMLDAYSALGMR